MTNIPNILCEPENIDRHMELETDGQVWCQHCYRELKNKNALLNQVIEGLLHTIELLHKEIKP